MNETIYTNDDILRMLDDMLRDEGAWWDGFYADREKPVPFFANVPDESLVEWFEAGLIQPGRVLELGCGPGRNAVYMAKQGCTVDAVDVSPISIEWARERAVEAGVDVNFICKDIFALEFEPGSYDLVYDGGCFHHIAPHRRMSFVSLLERAIRPGGLFGTVCMGALPADQMGGWDGSDWQVYRDRSMHGGLGYSLERLRTIFGGSFEELELRQMKDFDASAPVFGKPFLWVGLWRRG